MQTFQSRHLVRRSRWHRRLFVCILLAVIVVPLMLAFVPWQQSVQGRGRVLAYDPTERPQPVMARVGGQVHHWHVKEGDRVKAGDAIVDVEDNDSLLESRLNEQKKFLDERLRHGGEELAEQARVVDKQKLVMKANIEAARFAVEAARKLITSREKSLTAAQALYEQERTRYDLIAPQVRMGNRPEIEEITARASRDRALADVERSAAEIEQAKANRSQAEAMVVQAEAAGERAVAEALRDINRVEQAIFGIRREMQEIDNRIERFAARFVKAPCDGTLFRIEANASRGGAYVKEGDQLALIVPDVNGKVVVELLIDGMDVPLIRRDAAGNYPHVRLQFEGWPAVQFVGWPSSAVGTFGGKVVLVDSTDNGTGSFRILVEPDPQFDNDQWPGPEHLRQGNQAVGWVFLNRVTLGWELWRRLNGFPPALAPEGKSLKAKAKE